jgi:hypothetical protein
MNKSFLNYTLQLLLVAVVYVFAYSMLRDVLATRYFDGAWKIAALFFTFFALTHYGMVNKSKDKNKAAASVRYFMAATGIKMFMMMIVLVGYIILNRAAAVPFVICFFIGYLFFMVFDTAKNYKLMQS